MTHKKFTVVSPEGLHARPASLLTTIASKFSGEVQLEYNGNKNTAKSIMFVMSLGIKQNDSFTIYVDGLEEITLLNQIEAMFKENYLI